MSPPHLKSRKQETGVAAVLFKDCAELDGQHALFDPRFDPIAEDDQEDSQHAAPFVDGQGSAERCQVESGINRMTEMRVG
jgi:hypothetical protein